MIKYDSAIRKGYNTINLMYTYISSTNKIHNYIKNKWININS